MESQSNETFRNSRRRRYEEIAGEPSYETPRFRRRLRSPPLQRQINNIHYNQMHPSHLNPYSVRYHHRVPSVVVARCLQCIPNSQCRICITRAQPTVILNDRINPHHEYSRTRRRNRRYSRPYSRERDTTLNESVDHCLGRQFKRQLKRQMTNISIAYHYNRNRPHRGLTPNQINDIAMSSYNEQMSNNKSSQDSCTICLMKYQQMHQIKQLEKCGHLFHALCLNEWLRDHTMCPYCRQSVVEVDDIQDNADDVFGLESETNSNVGVEPFRR